MRPPLPGAVILILLLVPGPAASPAAASQLAPAVPFEDWGSCPFECCTYREWTVNQPTLVRKQRSPTSPVAFRLRQGEAVQGLTGVVVTLHAGRLRALANLTLEADTVVLNPRAGMTVGTVPGEPIRFRPGDRVYLMHYEGEGWYLYWFQGSLHLSALDFENLGTHTAPKFAVEDQVRTVWWVEVRNRQGQVGWTDSSDHFGHQDACGD